MSTLRQATEDYLALRRSMGFTLTVPGRQVQQFADHLDTLDATHVTIDLAVAWATRPAGTAPYYQWLRLSAVRGFAGYLHGIDPAHQVPPADLLPRQFHRPTPYLLSAADIAALIDAAGTLRPVLHAATYQTLIGLLAVAGLRPSEALTLDISDVDLQAGILTVHDKYGKTREILLHSSTVAALAGYIRLRDRMQKLGLTACEKNRLRSFLIRVEQHLGLDLESGVTQPGCHLVRLTAVDMNLHRVAAITLGLQPRHVADVKQELQRSAWTQCSVEVPEHSRHLVVGDVDQRLPGEQAGHRSGGEVQVRHRAHLEPQAGVVAPGHVDHPRGEVDTEGVDTELVQVGGDFSGAAADVRHRPAASGPHTVGEQRQSRAKILVPGESAAHLVGIADRDRVVRGSGVGQPVARDHDRHDSP